MAPLDEGELIRSVSAAVRDVVSAGQVPNVDQNRATKAITNYCAALENIVSYAPLWDRFRRDARTSSHFSSREVAALLAEIATPLGAAHEDLLRSCDYRVPPPPPVDQLVRNTRRSISGLAARQRWGVEHIDDAQSALYTYTTRIREQIAPWQSAPGGRRLKRVLDRCRSSAIIALLIALLSHLEVKTGDQLRIDVGFSIEDVVKVEVTLPINWANIGGEALVRTLTASSQLEALLESLAIVSPTKPDSASASTTGPSSLQRIPVLTSIASVYQDVEYATALMSDASDALEMTRRLVEEAQRTFQELTAGSEKDDAAKANDLLSASVDMLARTRQDVDHVNDSATAWLYTL